MSLIIELSPAEQQRLNVVAREEGITPSLLAQRVLRERLSSEAIMPASIGLVRGLRGKYAGFGVSTTDLYESRQAERDCEVEDTLK